MCCEVNLQVSICCDLATLINFTQAKLNLTNTMKHIVAIRKESIYKLSTFFSVLIFWITAVNKIPPPSLIVKRHGGYTN